LGREGVSIGNIMDSVEDFYIHTTKWAGKQASLLAMSWAEK